MATKGTKGKSIFINATMNLNPNKDWVSGWKFNPNPAQATILFLPQFHRAVRTVVVMDQWLEKYSSSDHCIGFPWIVGTNIIQILFILNDMIVKPCLPGKIRAA